MLSSSAISSPILDRKIEEAVAGLKKSYENELRSIGDSNTVTITDYIAAMKSEVNLSDNYRRDTTEALIRLSKYYDNKPFKDFTRIDVIAFLDSMRKIETKDPMHKWIGTYNTFRIYLLRFFKWLYYPDTGEGEDMDAALSLRLSSESYDGSYSGSVKPFNINALAALSFSISAFSSGV
jgi:hypothetical protein